jgi:hypothetical protein
VVGRVSRPGLHCSFCGGSQHDVRKLIAGPGVYICGACVELAGGVISSGQAAATRFGPLRAMPFPAAQVSCSFCGKPPGRVTTQAVLLSEPAARAVYVIWCDDTRRSCAPARPAARR